MNNPYAPPGVSPVPPPFPPAPATDDIARALEGLQYPLRLSFKILALASQATMTDATGRTVLYTKQKLLKFREHVEIFTDSNQATRLADIRANKVIDWSARYFSTDASGREIGSVGRRGWRSMWRAHYEAFNPGDNTPDSEALRLRYRELVTAAAEQIGTDFDTAREAGRATLAVLLGTL